MRNARSTMKHQFATIAAKSIHSKKEDECWELEKTKHLVHTIGSHPKTPEGAWGPQ
jgi:hypothetical protein